jgi:RNA polymerase sigma factor (sigma-70 family)
MPDAPVDPARWALLAVHRDYLLRIARGRTRSEQDAEDCVQEALLRCAQFADLDEERVVALLTSVTARLCVDLHRSRAARDRAMQRLTAEPAAAPSHEDAVCDRAEAAWVAGLVGALPRRQQQVVAARAAAGSGVEAAQRLGLSYKSVEAALGRARQTVRHAWKGVLVWLGSTRLRRNTAVAIVAAASVLTFGLGLRILGPHHPAEPGARGGGISGVLPELVPAAGRERGPRPLPALTRPPRSGGEPAPPGPPDRRGGEPSCMVGVGSACAGTSDPSPPEDLVQRVEDYVAFMSYCVSHGPQVRPSPLYARCPSPPPR